MKKIISLILVLMMIFSVTAVFAEAMPSVNIVGKDSGFYTLANGEKNGIIRFLTEIKYEDGAELEEYGMHFLPKALYPGSQSVLTVTNTDVENFASGDKFTADLKNISEGYMNREFIGIAFAKFKGSDTYVLSTENDLSYATVNKDKDLGVMQELQCDENGDFKILIVSDVHGKWEAAKTNIEILLNKENPDFVVINGDTKDPHSAFDETAFKNMIAPIESRGIKWTTINGNHDPYDAGRWAFFESFDGFVGENVDSSDPNYNSARPTNFMLPIYKNDGETPVFAVWAMDTGIYASGKYEGVTQEQINWYKAKSAEVKAEYGDLTGLMLLHIPPTEMIDLYYSKSDGGTNTVGVAGDAFQPIYGGIYASFDGVTNYTTSTGTVVAKTAMNATHPDNNLGVFAAMKEMGNIDISISGHDHANNYIGVYDGIMMGFAGRLVDESKSLGARVIEFNQKNPDKFTTKWIALSEEAEDQPEIYKDGTLVK